MQQRGGAHLSLCPAAPSGRVSSRPRPGVAWAWRPSVGVLSWVWLNGSAGEGNPRARPSAIGWVRLRVVRAGLERSRARLGPLERSNGHLAVGVCRVCSPEDNKVDTPPHWSVPICAREGLERSNPALRRPRGSDQSAGSNPTPFNAAVPAPARSVRAAARPKRPRCARWERPPRTRPYAAGASLTPYLARAARLSRRNAASRPTRSSPALRGWDGRTGPGPAAFAVGGARGGRWDRRTCR
jgi:hypothetical protein